MPRRTLLKVNEQAVVGGNNNPLGAPVAGGQESSLAATQLQTGLMGEKQEGSVLGQAITGTLVANPKSFRLDKLEGIVNKSIPGLLAPTDFRGWFDTKLGAYASHLGYTTTPYPPFVGATLQGVLRTDRVSVVAKFSGASYGTTRLEIFCKEYSGVWGTLNTKGTIFPGQGFFARVASSPIPHISTKYGDNPTVNLPDIQVVSGAHANQTFYTIQYFITGPNGEIIYLDVTSIVVETGEAVKITYASSFTSLYQAHFIISNLVGSQLNEYYVGSLSGDPTAEILINDLAQLSQFKLLENAFILDKYLYPSAFHGYGYFGSGIPEIQRNCCCLHKNRYFVGSKPEILRYGDKAANLRWTEPNNMFIIEADNYALVGDEPINYLASTPSGLYIFTSNEAYVGQGSFSFLLDDTRIEKLPIPVGADNNFGAVEGNEVYVIYKGNVWRVSGGDADMISAPLNETFTVVALEKNRRLLYAVANNGDSVYTYCLETQKWSKMNSVGFPVRDVHVFEFEGESTVRFIGEEEYAVYSSDNTDLYLQYEALDMGEPTTVKAFDRIIFRTQNASPPIVTGSIDGTPTTFAVADLPNGYYEARVTGAKQTGYTLTFDAVFTPTDPLSPAILYPPIEIDYTLRDAIR